MKDVQQDNGFSYIPYRARRNNSVLKSHDHKLLDKYLLKDFDGIALDGFEQIDLEIGFGSGEFMLSQARARPSCLHIGCEVYKPGVKKIIRQAYNEGLDNILVYMGDFRQILSKLPSFVFNDVYILFPDPWPKVKHQKRRLINQDFLQIISNFFKRQLHFATDYAGYAQEFSAQVMVCESMHLSMNKIREEAFFNTKFESKALARGDKIYHYICQNSLHSS